VGIDGSIAYGNYGGGMRLRLPELLKERGITTYRLAQDSSSRITLNMAYRLVRARGRFVTIRSDVLDALCEVLQVTSGELLEASNQERDRRIREAVRSAMERAPREMAAPKQPGSMSDLQKQREEKAEERRLSSRLFSPKKGKPHPNRRRKDEV
jgi:DNA-binding Xre family transcriptional regulator